MAHGHNVIEAYCKICKKAITQAVINGHMAVMVDGSWIHVFHTEEDREVLADKKYIDAIEEFVEYVEKAKEKSETPKGYPMEEKTKEIAKDRGLDFKKLELAISAFYSYSVANFEKRVL